MQPVFPGCVYVQLPRRTDLDVGRNDGLPFRTGQGFVVEVESVEHLRRIALQLRALLDTIQPDKAWGEMEPVLIHHANQNRYPRLELRAPKALDYLREHYEDTTTFV